MSEQTSERRGCAAAASFFLAVFTATSVWLFGGGWCLTPVAFIVSYLIFATALGWLLVLLYGEV